MTRPRAGASVREGMENGQTYARKLFDMTRRRVDRPRDRDDLSDSAQTYPRTLIFHVFPFQRCFLVSCTALAKIYPISTVRSLSFSLKSMCDFLKFLKRIEKNIGRLLTRRTLEVPSSRGHFPARDDSSKRCRIDVNSMISISIRRVISRRVSA